MTIKQYWRNFIPVILKANTFPTFCSANFDPIPHTDIYEFGVYTGTSMCEIMRDLKVYQLPVRKIWGFDAFDGMPVSEAEKDVCHAGWLGSTKEGLALNAVKELGVASVEDAVKTVEAKVRETIGSYPTEVKCIPGWFSNSLKDDKIVEEHGMLPALYVDIDCDFGKSTEEALDFMFRNNLIVPGTLIGYDDWGGTTGWRTCSDGESKAHMTMMEKYGVTCDVAIEITNEGEADGKPHTFCQKIFRVISVKPKSSSVSSNDRWINEWLTDK